MQVAVLLQDQEAAGKTGSTCIQVGNRKLIREDYHRFLEHYGVSETDFLETAIAFGDSASAKEGHSMPYVLVTEAPLNEAEFAGVTDFIRPVGR